MTGDKGHRRIPRNWGHVCIGATVAGTQEFGQIGGMVYLPLSKKICPDCGARQ